MEKTKIGLMGLAVMGQNLVLNIERNGFPISVYNRTTTRTNEFIQNRGLWRKIVPAVTVEEFLSSLEKPRKIIMMVQAGAAVDSLIQQLLPSLDAGDLLIDGGNSFFPDTERRAVELEQKGLLFLGVGISGGEYGALNGPSIMPGGQVEAYKHVEPIFKTIAAKVDSEPCVTYIGPRGAGHYVKMVHNGIEYGDMQLIAEIYDIMHRVLEFSTQELQQVFIEWNQGELSSYLIEITGDIMGKLDADTGKPLLELILDEAQQKGTGKWTSQNSFDLGVATPTINAAVESRILSSFKAERLFASKRLNGPRITFQGNRDKMITTLCGALYAAKICSYAQGFALLRAASRDYKYDLNYGEIARIWRGGCIIRAQFLDKIRFAYDIQPDLENLLIDPELGGKVQRNQKALRTVIKLAVENGIPCLALSASLSYFDAYRAARLPANLTQAQRDYFGAHTYQRIDKPGTFHTEWI